MWLLCVYARCPVILSCRAVFLGFPEVVMHCLRVRGCRFVLVVLASLGLAANRRSPRPNAHLVRSQLSCTHLSCADGCEVPQEPEVCSEGQQEADCQGMIMPPACCDFFFFRLR